MVSFEFFIDIILPATLWLWGWLHLSQKGVRGIFPGGHRWPVRRANNPTTFMCLLSWNLGVSTSWNTQGLFRPVQGLLYLYCTKFSHLGNLAPGICSCLLQIVWHEVIEGVCPSHLNDSHQLLCPLLLAELNACMSTFFACTHTLGLLSGVESDLEF